MFDEVAILEILNDRAQAIRRKDATAAIGFYGDDVVNFDLAPPLAYRGKEVTDPAELQSWFDTWTSPIEMSFAQMKVLCTGDLALAYGLMHMTANARMAQGPTTGREPRPACNDKAASGKSSTSTSRFR